MDFRGTFLKFDPRLQNLDIDLGLLNAKDNAYNYFAIRGDFMPTDNPRDTVWYRDAFQNLSISVNGAETWGGGVLTQAGSLASAVISNGDWQYGAWNNSDPDNDYGVFVCALPFSDENDNFDFTKTILPQEVILAASSVLSSSGGGDDNVHLWNKSSAYFASLSEQTFDAGAGNDTIIGGDANDLIHGGNGIDQIRGGLGDDTLYPDDGAGGTVFGEAGNDKLFGWFEADSMEGGVGNDSLYGENGNDTLKGGTGDDTVEGANDNDSLFGGPDTDRLEGGAGNDRIDGGDGIDTAIFNGSGRDYVFEFQNTFFWTTTGPDGNDKVLLCETYQFDNSTVTDQELFDQLVQPDDIAPINQKLNELKLNDLNFSSLITATQAAIDGAENIHTLGEVLKWATIAKAVVNSTVGVMAIVEGVAAGIAVGLADLGANTIGYALASDRGDAYEKYLWEKLISGLADNLVGGAGLVADLIFNAAEFHENQETIANAREMLEGLRDNLQAAQDFQFNVQEEIRQLELELRDRYQIENDLPKVRLPGDSSATPTYIEGLAEPKSPTLITGDGGEIKWGDGTDNRMLGTGKQDFLGGLDGKDALSGKGGRDVLEGGMGADKLDGGNGTDSLKGGTGADVFVFSTALNASTNVDRIADFTSDTDHLSISKSVMTALGAVGTLSASAFWSGAGAVAGHDATDRIVYNTSTGALYFDADGNSSGAAVEIAILTGHPTVLNTDILVF